MRERRTTVRVTCFLPAQCRVIDQPLPLTGRVTNISAEGLRVLASSPLQEHQHVRLAFALPTDEEEELAVNGVVRWCQPDSVTADGRPVGVEFEHVDETTRFRLQSFIAEQSQREAQAGGLAKRVRSLQAGLLARAFKIGWPLLIGLVGAGGCVWILWLQRQQEQLRQGIADRAALISQLEAQQQSLRQELDQARSDAVRAGTALEQLQTQRLQAQTENAWLTQNLGELKQAYLRLREEREALKQWIQTLERQQHLMEQRLTSIPELRKALRQAYHAKAQQRLERWKQWLAHLRHEPPSDSLLEGNRGYLIRDGQPTATSASLSIRVLEPTTDSSP